MRDGTGRYGRALLLGGTSEIGLAIVAELDFSPGAEVLLAGRDVAALERVPLPPGVRRRCLEWDATKPSGPLVEQVLTAGDLDVVIAASALLGTGAQEDPDLAREVLATNLVGLVDVLMRLGEALRVQRHGTIIVLSSVAALRARRSTYLYGASKAGLDAFASGLADRLEPHGVRVLLVRPGFVTGRMTEGLPVAPFATTPQAVGRAVRRGLATRRRVVWVPPVLAVVLPVLQLLPRRIWRRLDR